jgi:pilus assembly protein CpaF
MSFAIILPFLKPIAHLIEDPSITEIMVNGSGRVFVERAGRLEPVAGVAVREQNLRVAVRNLARALGDDISEEQPLLDSRLPDGSRVAAALPPVSLGGTTLTIRKFQTRHFTPGELVRIGTLTEGQLDLLRDAIRARVNILVSGGTGTGKTTLLNALTAFLPADDRLVLIEETAELQLDTPNLVRFEARRDQAGLPAVTIRDLLRATLRHRPDRILVGEVRGGEAFDLLQALNTGHSGTLSTIHASSAELALRRLASCVLQCGVDWPYIAIRHGIGECRQLLVHLERRDACRVVTELVRVQGYDPATTPTICGACRERGVGPRAGCRNLAASPAGVHRGRAAPGCPCQPRGRGVGLRRSLDRSATGVVSRVRTEQPASRDRAHAPRV